MHEPFLGSTGVRVAPLCLGTMSFGSQVDCETSAALFAAARDAGVNVFEEVSAHNYGAR